MPQESTVPQPSQPRWMTYTGWFFTLLIFGTLLFSAWMKFSVVLKIGPWEDAAKEFSSLGISPETMAMIGGVEVVCALLYLFPRTAILGAVLLQGYLAAAFCTHLIARERNPAAEFELAPLIVAALMWLGILLREPRLRAIMFWR
ncbi:hypothetical protein ETAA8_07070 [Anatilimnocola aggregata]|uniref:DoxX family protein n=1 Tax=Anatilimnocola aggregata TaxID=2528021 RepID=A0A517Y5W6_9BACT|nr:DoxX family protein [Anatilimnocola aggregata]QDU25637.1 hypothetical protein ETAA8_07070 [Anatilimnocola aggregata]